MTDRLPKTIVLKCVRDAISRQSNYVNDQVQRWHAKNGTGHAPSAQLVLRRLKRLEADGMLTRSRSSKGSYGFTWTITDKGRTELYFAGHGGL